MTYTISGKHYTEFDINKLCADFIPVAIDKNQDAAVKSKSSSVLVNNFEYTDLLFRFVKISATISIGEAVDVIPYAIFQDSFITLFQSGDNLIFQ